MKPLEVLGLPPGARSDEIRTAYRLMALRHHPDRADGGGDAGRFRAAGAAYQVLVKGVGADGAGISNRRAHDLFSESIFELAGELARLGYDEAFIVRALAEEGCPPGIAASAAADATGTAPRQRDRGAGPWRFSQEPPLPMLEPASRTGFGFAAKMGVLAIFLCASLALLAWLVPETLHRARSVIDPLRAALPSFDQDREPSARGAMPMPATPPPTALPVVEPVAAPRPRPASPPAAVPRATPAADTCGTDRDCPTGSRCTRSSTHAAWACTPR